MIAFFEVLEHAFVETANKPKQNNGIYQIEEENQLNYIKLTIVYQSKREENQVKHETFLTCNHR